MLLALRAIGRNHTSLVGHKAATLGLLSSASFPVPPGVCVTTDAWRQALGPYQRGLQRIVRAVAPAEPATAFDAAAEVTQLLADLAAPYAVVNALPEMLGRIGSAETRWVVRSSAEAEDTVGASYAGQYTTVIGVVGQQAVLDAIVAVWRSYFSANALLAGARPDDSGMAVLIQPLIEPECAGFGFTVDPVSKARSELVLNAAWGLGSGVADGVVAADTYWIDRAGFAIKRRDIVTQATQVGVSATGAVEEHPVPLDRQDAATLPDRWVHRLAALGVSLEQQLGSAQEFEWAISDNRLWLLQSRLQTGLPDDVRTVTPFTVAWDDSADADRLWTQQPNPMLPDAVVQPLEQERLRNHAAASRDGSTWYGRAVFTDVRFAHGRAYFADVPTGLSPADQRVRQAYFRDLGERLLAEDTTTWAYWGPELAAAQARLAAFRPNEATDTALAAHVEDAFATYRRAWMMHGPIFITPWQTLHDAYVNITGCAPESAPEQVAKLLQGVGNVLTEVIDELYALAQLARQTPSVQQAVAIGSASAVQQLAAMPEAAPFLTAWTAFFNRYGTRNGDGWGSTATLHTPTWREEPEQVLGLLRTYLSPDVTPPHVRVAEAEAARQAAVDALCAACPDPDAVAEFRRLLAYFRRQKQIIEEHNHIIDQLSSGHLRRAVMAAAGRLVERGVLAQRDEVFWLWRSELEAALVSAEAPEYAARIAERKAEHAAWQALDAPFVIGRVSAELPPRPPLTNAVTPSASEADRQLHGLAASAGQYTGRARVVPLTERLPDVAPGDILVAEIVGPLWTPIYPILGAIVLDRGTLGNHAATTAREYGIPTVVATGGATRRIADGSTITVDGSTGSVTW